MAWWSSATTSPASNTVRAVSRQAAAAVVDAVEDLDLVAIGQWPVGDVGLPALVAQVVPDAAP